MSIEGKHIVVTGKLTRGTRSEIHEIIKQKMGIVRQAVNLSTDYLVVGDLSRCGGSSKKLRRAKELKITTLTEEEFFDSCDLFGRQN